MGQCGAMWRNMGQCRAIWGNVSQCGVMWDNVGQCGTMWGNVWYNYVTWCCVVLWCVIYSCVVLWGVMWWCSVICNIPITELLWHSYAVSCVVISCNTWTHRELREIKNRIDSTSTHHLYHTPNYLLHKTYWVWLSLSMAKRRQKVGRP